MTTAKRTPAATPARSRSSRARKAPTTLFGVDIGGTGIKGAPVDLDRGALAAERHRILTPKPATPVAVADVVAEVVAQFGWNGPVGCTFPAIVKNGVTLSASNVDASWIGTDADAVFTERLGMEVHMVNDADAAGLAEVRYGAGKGIPGTVVLLTLGTGIGSALFHNGVLVPNSEFGHLLMPDGVAEKLASEKARIDAEISWKKYAKRLDEYLDHVCFLLSPDLIILGGGGAAKSEKFLPRLTTDARVVPAVLGNDAGIIGAAMIATA